MTQKFSKKKAFTLIELLIVIAIIGILFIVLVSKVDFATDKAKATGVQTDFRSFQMAFDTVARENAGFNTLGYNTGDIKRADFDTALAGYTYTNELKDTGDGIKNSYDAGDTNLNGKQDGSEVFTGRKIYTEVWSNVYTFVKPGTNVYDVKVLSKLETAINANLDPKLHITIKDNGEIVMANGAQDPWKNEYHGEYITNAEIDGLDRGAIVMYSDGPNGVWGSEHTIENGYVSIIVPNSNKDGKDDYSLVSCYTYINGYGEVKNITTGFSNNQGLSAPGNHVEYVSLEGSGQVYYTLTPADLSFRSNEPLSEFVAIKIDGQIVDSSNYTLTEGSTIVTLHNDYLDTLSARKHDIIVVSENKSARGTFNVVEQTLNSQHFYYDVPYMCGILDENGDLSLDQPMGIMMRKDGNIYLTWYQSYDCFPVIKTTYTVSGNIMNINVTNEIKEFLGVEIDTLTGIISEDGLNVYFDGYANFAMSTAVAMSEGEYFYAHAWFIMGPFVLDNTKESYSLPLYNYDGLDLTFSGTYRDCVNLKKQELPLGCKEIGKDCFINCVSLTSVTIPVTVKVINGTAFSGCTSLATITYNGTMEQWNSISLQSGWNRDIQATNVICSDGVVTIK